MAERLINNLNTVITVDQIGEEQRVVRWNGVYDPKASVNGLRLDILQRRVPTRGENYRFGYVTDAGTDHPVTWVDIHTVMVNGDEREVVVVDLRQNEDRTRGEMVIPGEHQLPGSRIAQGEFGSITFVTFQRSTASTFWETIPASAQ